MRRLLLLLLAATLFAGACSRKNGGGGARLRSDADSAAYVLGMNVGLQLMRMDSMLNIDAVCRGLRDAAAGTALFTIEEGRDFYLRYVNFLLPEKARAYEEQFLADIAKSNRAYARTRSGVTYTVDELGDQDQQNLASVDRDTVTVRWIIRNAEGRELYSSYERDDTLRLALSELRPGVRESVKLIGRGGRITAWLPAREAYGAEGDPELGIGANATLCYEIELIAVDKWNTRR